MYLNGTIKLPPQEKPPELPPYIEAFLKGYGEPLNVSPTHHIGAVDCWQRRLDLITDLSLVCNFGKSAKATRSSGYGLLVAPAEEAPTGFELELEFDGVQLFRRHNVLIWRYYTAR